MASKPRILVTGSSGLLAGYLLPELARQDYRVYALIRKTSRVGPALDKRIVFRYGDLLDRDSLRDSLKDIDIVIHLAALMSDKECLPLSDFLEVNVSGTKNLIVESYGKIRQFIYISTVGVYGPTKASPAAENDSYGNRLSKYEYSKKEAERALIDFSKEKSFAYTILRLGQLYGAAMRYGWPQIMDRMEKGKMFILGDGKSLLQLTHIKDAVSGIMLSIDNKKSMNQIFNICAEKAYSVKEIFNTLSAQMEKPRLKQVPFLPFYLVAAFLQLLPYRIKKVFSLEYLDLHRLSFFNTDHIYSISKAREYLGYQPSVDLASGIRDMVNWYREYKMKGLLT